MTSASCCSGQLCNQFTVPSVKCSTISRCWIILPVLFYILLFLLNPLLKSSAQYSTKGLGQECKLNFIVAADTFLFDRILYRLLPRAEIGTKQPAFPLRILVAVVDFVAGIPYLLHFTLPFVYSAWLMVKKRESITFYQFLLAFGLTCSVGVLVQYALPTPPPWMIPPAKVELSSSATPTFIPLPPEGNFCRIDRILGFALFKKLYAQNSLVCGAFPSLHTAWPTVLLFTKPWIGRWFCWMHVGLIAFAAMWSLHHWVLDIVFGFGIGWICCKASKALILATFPQPAAEKSVTAAVAGTIEE